MNTNLQQQNTYYPYNFNQFQRPQAVMPEQYITQPVQSFLKCRPVVSLDEARAAQIDLDGSLNVFTDVANKKIYTKQINPDGTASLKVYILSEQPETVQPEYITREEFEKAIASLKHNSIDARPTINF